MARVYDIFVRLLAEGRNPQADMRAMFATYVKHVQKIKAMIDALPPESEFRKRQANNANIFSDPDQLYKLGEELALQFKRYDRSIWAFRWMLLGAWNRYREILGHALPSTKENREDPAGRAIVSATQYYYAKLCVALGWNADWMPLDFYQVKDNLQDGLRGLGEIAEKTKIDIDTLLDNINFDVKAANPASLIHRVAELREKYAAQLRGDIRSANKAGDLGEIVLEYDDGSAWVHLDCRESDLEGELMHHCGAGEGTLYSYRALDPKTKIWRPLITVDVDDKSAVQIRGPSNKEPNDEDSLAKLADLFCTNRVNGLSDDSGLEWDDFTSEQQRRIQDAHGGRFWVDHETEECSGCGDSFDPEDIYNCEYCGQNYCQDCEHEHLWGADNTSTYWFFLDGQHPTMESIPNEWEDNDKVIKDFAAENIYWHLLKDRGSYKDRRGHIEFFKQDSQPEIRFIYTKDGRFLGREVFGEDFETVKTPDGYDYNDREIEDWIHQEYGPDVEIDTVDRQAAKDAPVKSGKQPLLYKDKEPVKESVRNIAARLFRGLQGGRHE